MQSSVMFPDRLLALQCTAMRILLLAISAVTSLATGAVLLLPAGNVPAASPPAVHQAVAAVAVLPAASDAGQASASTSAPADHGTLAAVIRVKTVRVDPEGAEVQEQPAAPQARQPETSMVDPSTPSAAEEPAATLSRRETDRASAVPTRITKSARTTRRVAYSRRFATRRKARQQTDEASASDGALSYAPRQPGLESPNPFDRLFSR
jgi:hypothetical protein